jgi:hypothetical protein
MYLRIFIITIRYVQTLPILTKSAHTESAKARFFTITAAKKQYYWERNTTTHNDRTSLTSSYQLYHQNSRPTVASDIPSTLEYPPLHPSLSASPRANRLFLGHLSHARVGCPNRVSLPRSHARPLSFTRAHEQRKLHTPHVPHVQIQPPVCTTKNFAGG